MRKFLAFLLVNAVFFIHVTQAQTSQIKGRITDAKDGSPIPNASVKIKGTKSGTATDQDGVFLINAPSSKVTLEVSSIGYTTTTVTATAGKPVTVKLENDTKALSEVVITGVGVATSKKKLAFAVESVTADKLPPAPTADIGQALVGKIPGAQISSVNGSPGQPVNILLRGINTLWSGTKPMILMDGIEVQATSLESLDLTNIDRVEVIQGAAAATIYGAQGANGVIQIFTKKGKAGKLSINFSSSIAVNELLNVGNLHKAYYHSFETNANNEVIGSSGNPLVFDSTLSMYPENVIWNSTAFATNNNKPYNRNLQYYDHFKMFFQKAPTWNNSVSVSGGSNKFDFAVTASDSRQETVFKNNGNYSRSNLTSNIGAELFKGLTFRSINQLVYTKNTQLDPDGRNMFYAINNSRPFANYDFKSADGNYGAYFGDAVGVNGFNFNYVQQYTDVTDEKIDVIQNFNLNYKLPKFVELDVKYGLNYQYQEVVQNIKDQSNNENAAYFQTWVENYAPHWTSYGVPNARDETGELDHYQYKTSFQNFLSTATIRTDFDKDFHLNIPLRTTTMVAFDTRKRVYKRYITYGLDAPSYTPYTASQMSTYKIADDYKEPFITYGYLVNQRFDYGDIAGISGGIRSDYSSAFGRGSKPFTFPRGDAYVRLSAMNFWQGTLAEVVSEFKFRGAYGEAGIQPHAFDRFPTLPTKNIGNFSAFRFNVDNSNPDLNVEVSKELELGTDMSFNILQKQDWLRSVNFSLTWWKRTTDNAIYKVDEAPSAGVGTIIDNAFSLESKGIQASLNLNVLSSKNFTWNFTTNFGKQTSKITAIKGPEIVVTSNAGSSNYVLKAGEKIGQLYGFVGLHSVDQIDPATGNPFISKDLQSNYVVASNGWVVEKATRLPYFSANQYSFGDPNPKFNMSFINDVAFKNFLSFSMQWDWVNGSHLYNQTKEWMYRDGIHGDYDKEITIEGQTGAWAAFYRGIYAQRSRNGTKNYFYEDASFLRLRNVAVALDFARLFNIKALQKLQLVLSGRNLVTFTKYTGMDPEINSGTNNSGFDRGVDHNTIPNLKTWQAGVNIGF